MEPVINAPEITAPESADREIAVRVHDLSKAYPIFAKPEDRLKQMFLRGYKKLYQEFWALRGVGFEVSRGETVGILGRNGSGKTTLLEIISGTVTPTGGEVDVRGTVAALLGLGAGFSPEFTGRENIVLNATLLGLGEAELAARMDDIVAFADIGRFLDQPVKTYSSGMYSRLAFAVAINVDPDILVVDESLSVGDEAFQRKCFDRIERLKNKGCTILFVTHNSHTVVDLCDRAILLDRGELLMTGEPRRVVGQYHRLVYAPEDRAEAIRADIRRIQAGEAPALSGPATTIAGGEPAGEPDLDDDPEAGDTHGLVADYDPQLTSASLTEYASTGAVLSDVRIETPGGRRVNTLVHGRRYDYCYRVRFERPCFGVMFGMMFKTTSGVEVTGRISHRAGEGPMVSAGDVIDVRFPFRARMLPGTYFANAGVAATESGELSYLHRFVDVVMFRVMGEPGMTAGGLVDCTEGPVALKPADAPGGTAGEETGR